VGRGSGRSARDNNKNKSHAISLQAAQINPKITIRTQANKPFLSE